MRKDLENLSPLSKECCIYKVPRRLRVLNEKAYAPQVVSIDPFHRDKKELQEMEEHKRMYLQDFLKWSNMQDWRTLLNSLAIVRQHCVIVMPKPLKILAVKNL
jgi:hypothetical protein|uniref:Uncharacterized protein n=1 Tax=Populus trichocarpa TaxID=3694 RepID=A0A2K2BQY8_POPTR